MEYLRGDRGRPLILGTDNEGMVMWYANALFCLLRIQTCTGILVVEWQWGEAFPFQYPPSRSWTQRVWLQVSYLALTIWCQLYCGLAISCYHRDMESLRIFCCQTIRVQSYLSGTVKPLVGSVQGISTFATFSSWSKWIWSSWPSNGALQNRWLLNLWQNQSKAEISG